MNDYINLYFNSVLSLGTPESLLALLFLGLARLLPIIQLSPFFGSRTLPQPVKVGFAITLFAVFLPSMLINLTAPVYFNMQFLLMIFKELFVGYSIGWIMSMPFTIVQNVGMIIDHQRGGASLQVNDPTIQTQSSPIGTMFNLILIFVFYFIDGPFYFLEAINTSYELLPPDRVLSARFFTEASTFWQIQIRIFNRMMVLSTQLVAPPLITILMTDMFLGIANRLAPQVQITFLGLPLKSLLALFVVYLGWRDYNQQTIVLIFQWLDTLKNAIFSLSL
jgi:type III secretion protein T